MKERNIERDKQAFMFESLLDLVSVCFDVTDEENDFLEDVLYKISFNEEDVTYIEDFVRESDEPISFSDFINFLEETSEQAQQKDMKTRFSLLL